jgi:putative ABC transport system permease protein
MMMLFRSVWSRMTKNPLRGILTIVGVGIGVAAVTLTLNITDRFLSANSLSFESPGSRLVAANATVVNGRQLQWEQTPVFRLEQLPGLLKDIPSLKALSPLATVNLSRIQVGEDFYQTRSALGIGPGYKDIYGLKLVAGSFLSQDDLDQAKNVLVISEAAAKALFGSAEKAIAQIITEIRTTGRQGDAQNMTMIQGGGGAGPAFESRIFGAQTVTQQAGAQTTRTNYSVVGVFASIPELKAETYGISDFLVPYSVVPSARRGLASFACLSSSTNYQAESAKLSAALKAIYGADAKISVWQGTPRNFGDPVGNALRQMNSMALFLDSFGLIALIVSSIGIFSIMMVGIIERSREIGLRRAIGSTRFGIISWFLGEAVIISFMGSVVGIILAALFNGPAIDALKPFVAGFGREQDVAISRYLGPLSILYGILASLFTGAVFGLFPAMSAAKISPVESLRDS